MLWTTEFSHAHILMVMAILLLVMCSVWIEMCITIPVCIRRLRTRVLKFLLSWKRYSLTSRTSQHPLCNSRLKENMSCPVYVDTTAFIQHFFSALNHLYVILSWWCQFYSDIFEVPFSFNSCIENTANCECTTLFVSFCSAFSYRTSNSDWVVTCMQQLRFIIITTSETSMLIIS